MWKMIRSCLLWCLWREMNDKNFKLREWTLAEIKFFNTLYLLTVAFVSPLVISYHNFLLFGSFSYLLPVYLGAS